MNLIPLAFGGGGADLLVLLVYVLVPIGLIWLIVKFIKRRGSQRVETAEAGAAYCPSCGNLVESDQQFCPKCGAAKVRR